MKTISTICIRIQTCVLTPEGLELIDRQHCTFSYLERSRHRLQSRLYVSHTHIPYQVHRIWAICFKFQRRNRHVRYMLRNPGSIYQRGFKVFSMYLYRWRVACSAAGWQRYLFSKQGRPPLDGLTTKMLWVLLSQSNYVRKTNIS